MAGPIDYQSLQAPERVDTSLPDNDAAQRALDLSNTFKEFAGVSNDVAKDANVQAGAIAGAASGATGTPQYREGLNRFTAYSQAYNNAATRSYLVEAQATAQAQSAQLQIQADKDPAAFAATFAAVRDATVKNAPPLAQAELTNMYNEHLAQGLSNVTAQHYAQIQEKQRALVDVGIGISTNKIAKLNAQANSGDAEAGARADDELAKLSAFIDGAVNSGTISKADGEARMIAAHRQITEDTIKAGLERELETNPDPLAGIKYIQKFQEYNRTNPTLPEDEEKKITLGLFTDLKQYNLMVHGTMYQVKSAEEQKWENGNAKATIEFLNGTLTAQKIAMYVANGDLKPDRATSLDTLMLQGPRQEKSDQRVVRDIKLDPNFLDLTNEEILSRRGLSPQDQAALIAERDKRKNSYESTQSFKDGVGNIMRALKIPPGTPTTLMSDEQRKAYTNAVQLYHDHMRTTDPAARDSMADSVSRKVIQQINASTAAAEADTYTRGKADYMRRHGPDSGPQYPGDKAYQEKLKWYDKTIAEKQAAAKQGASQ